MKVKCPQCEGKGEYPCYSDAFKITYPVKCSLCDGAGKVDKSVTAYRGPRQKKERCDV